MDKKLFIFGATLLLSVFISYNRALPLKPYGSTTIDRFVHDVEKFYLTNVDKEKLNDKISDKVMQYLHMWENINRDWFFFIYLIVSIQDGVNSTTSTLAANEVPSTHDRTKAFELIREFTRDLERGNRDQLNATRFYEMANNLSSPALILSDLVEWKASRDAMLKTLYDFIMADAVKSKDSSRNLSNFLSRQYVSVMCLKIKSANLPIPVNTGIFKEKANNNPSQAIQIVTAYEDMKHLIMLKSIYSIVIEGSEGMNSTNYMKSFISRSKNDVHWLPRKNPFPQTIRDFAYELMDVKATMHTNITLFEEKAAIDPALTTEFLNLYFFTARFNMFQEMLSIVNGAGGFNSLD